MRTIRKRIDLGPFDWDGVGKKNHRVELELELRHDENDRAEFSVCGTVYDSPASRSDRHIVSGGQCLDEIFERADARPWLEVYELWKRWHLNGLRAGSPRQEAAVKAWGLSHKYSYDEACEMLKGLGLYEDAKYVVDGRPYVYGTAWLYEEIDEADMAKILKWLGAGKEKTK